MAFMGRGGGPSINIGNINANSNRNDNSNNKGDNDGNDYYFRPHYFWGRYHYYIPLDNAYVATSIIITFIIFVVTIIAYWVTYKPMIIDPIESTKRLFINTYLTIIIILLASTFITNFFSKKESILGKRLIIVFTISIIIMLVFWGIRVNLDKTYTIDKFEQFYIEQNVGEDDNTKSKIDIGLTGMSLKTEKEYYVDECMEAYNIFKIRTYGILGIHLLLNVLLIYQIARVSKIHDKKARINKDDIILFDEEQNIRY